jgi:transcriptional regulator with XRE-family HTH domain
MKSNTMGKRNESRDIAALVGARIEVLRIERGLSVRNLAQMVDCSITHLSLMESGCSSITVCTLQKIARALRVEPFDLLNHAPENDDIGYIVEKMRQDPAARAMMKAHLKRGT